MQALEAALGTWSGLHLAGNYLNGVGLEQAVASGSKVARAILLRDA